MPVHGSYFVFYFAVYPVISASIYDSKIVHWHKIFITLEMPGTKINCVYMFGSAALECKRKMSVILVVRTVSIGFDGIINHVDKLKGAAKMLFPTLIHPLDCTLPSVVLLIGNLNNKGVGFWVRAHCMHLLQVKRAIIPT